jgi:hypothetical protein
MRKWKHEQLANLYPNIDELRNEMTANFISDLAENMTSTWTIRQKLKFLFFEILMDEIN